MISLPQKATTHLLYAIAPSDTQISIRINEFDQILSYDGDVYLMLRGPVYRELVKVDQSLSSWGNYLKIARGQGGTQARAWPRGALLFATTHEDHYNSILQAGESRTIDYNPNQILSPLYAGEKIYQSGPSGCERWWKSFNAVNPYWDIITGDPCAAEEYTDIGWTYDLLKSTAPPLETHVLTVYSEPGDGFIDSYGGDWQAVRDNNGLEAWPTSTNDSGAVAASQGGAYVICRSFFEFDLDAISLTDRTITKIELDLVNYGYNESTIQIYGSDFTGDVAAGEFPYQDFGATAFLDSAFALVMWDGEANYNRNVMLLNAAGKAFVEAAFGGLVAFCVREYDHDVLNVPPVGTTHRNGLFFRDIGYNDPIRTPRLLITYEKSPEWTQHLDNTKWTATNGATWDGTKWNSSSGSIELAPAGTWADGYKPYKIRVTFAGEAEAWLEMRNTQGSGELLAGLNLVSSGDEVLITNYNGYDISDLYIFLNGSVSNIEFLEP
jgi:hypothetical protein